MHTFVDFHVNVACNTNASDVCEIKFIYLLTVRAALSDTKQLDVVVEWYHRPHYIDHLLLKIEQCCF